jgi:hypothetical protein
MALFCIHQPTVATCFVYAFKMLQVFVVGPLESGKSTISNYIADLSDSLNNREYQATKGVRILEFEKSILQNSQRVNIDGCSI